MKKFKNIIFILFLIFKTCFCFKNNFENSFTTPSEIVSENPYVNKAINTIYQININVNAESPLTDSNRWQFYLDKLKTQVSVLVRQEQSFNSVTAKNVADSTLNTLDLLLPLDRIWSTLETTERYSAGQHFLKIVETISVMMNIHVHFSIPEGYMYPPTNRDNYFFYTFAFNYSENLNKRIGEVQLNLPFKALILPNNYDNLQAATIVKLTNLRHYMTPLVNDSGTSGDGVYPSVITVKVGTFKESLPIMSGYKFEILVWEKDSLFGNRQCTFMVPPNFFTGSWWSVQKCNVSLPTSDYPQICECDNLSGIGFGVFDDSYPFPDDDVTFAIKSIVEITNKISDEHSLKDVEKWFDYLQELNQNCSVLIGKELTFHYHTAITVANSALSALTFLLPLDQIWSSLKSSFDRLIAGQFFLTITETISVMMSIHVNQNRFFYWLSFGNSYISFRTYTANYTHSYVAGDEFRIDFFLNGVSDIGANDVSVFTTATLTNLRRYMKPLLNDSSNFTVYPSVIIIKVDDYKDNFLIKNGRKFKIVVGNLDSLAGSRQCAFFTTVKHQWLNQGCNVSVPTIENPQVCMCDDISGIGLGVFEDSSQLDDNDEISATTNTIYQIKNNVSVENPIENEKTWRNYLQNLDAQISLLVGKELTFSSFIAKQIAESTLSTIELLLPHDKIWSSLTLSNRLEAGQYFLSIIETVSVMMNLQIHQNNKNYYNYSTTNNTILFFTKKFDYNESFSRILFEDFAGVIIPSYALGRPDNELSNSFAMTLSWVANLRQYMTPLNKFSEKVNPSMLALKISDNKSSNLTNISEKFLITFYENSSLVYDRKIAFWIPNAENVNTNNWSSKGCNAPKDQFDDDLIYECDHISGIGFGIFEHSQLQDVNPDEIANEIEQVLENITQIGNNLSTEQWKDALTNLTDLISNLTFSDDVIANVSRLLAVQITNSSLNAFSQLIEAPKNVWENLTINERKNAASKILKSISNLSILMNSKQTTNIEVLQFNNIEMRSKAFGVNQTVTFNFNNATTIELPVKSVLKHSNFFSKNDFQVALSVTLIKSLSQHLNVTNFLPNSDILSVTVANHRESINLNDGLKLKFVTHHNVLLVFRDRPLCSFWNLTTNDWSTDGCKIINKQSNRSSTACECNHLTDLSIIVDVSNRETPSKIKTILSYISSSFSSIFLAMTIAFSLKFNYAKYTLYEDQFNVKKNRFWLNLNLTIWLLVSHLLIMFGMDRNEIKEICQISSLALFYSLLTAFCFSLMISVHLYLTSLEKLLFCYFSLKKFVLFAYVFPFVFILFSMILIFFLEVEKNFKELFKSMTGEYFCWISSSQYPSHVWLFVGPMTVIIYANCCLLCATLLGRYLNKLKKIKKKNNNENEVHDSIQHSTSLVEVKQNSLNNYVNWHMVLVLLFNFGLPWMLYVFYINEQMAPVFSYVFILFNGTQGVSLFAEQYYVYNKNYYKKKI